MPAIKGEKRNLTSIVDEMFDVMEHIHAMLQNWCSSYHLLFINRVLKLRDLEDELYQLGYDGVFVLTVKRAIYQTVFSEAERTRVI